MAIPLEIETPDTVPDQVFDQAQPEVESLRALLTGGALPPGLTAPGLAAVLTIMDAVMLAAVEDKIDLSPSEAAMRLRMARPSVMRLIARGELTARRDGGHYVLSPREVRLFQARLGVTRREALASLAEMAAEFGG